MISLGNVGSENETISEKNLTEVHFVVTNIYGQRQWYRSQRVQWLVTISLGLTGWMDLGRCLLYTASRKSLHHYQEEFTGLHTHLPLSNVILRSLQEGAGLFWDSSAGRESQPCLVQLWSLWDAFLDLVEPPLVSTWEQDLGLPFPSSLNLIHQQVLSAVPSIYTCQAFAHFCPYLWITICSNH